MFLHVHKSVVTEYVPMTDGMHCKPATGNDFVVVLCYKTCNNASVVLRDKDGDMFRFIFNLRGGDVIDQAIIVNGNLGPSPIIPLDTFGIRVLDYKLVYEQVTEKFGYDDINVGDTLELIADHESAPNEEDLLWTVKFISESSEYITVERDCDGYADIIRKWETDKQEDFGITWREPAFKPLSEDDVNKMLTDLSNASC